MKILHWLALIILGFILGAALGILSTFLICSIFGGEYCPVLIFLTTPIGAAIGAVALPFCIKIGFESDNDRIKREKAVLSKLLLSTEKQKRKRSDI